MAEGKTKIANPLKLGPYMKLVWNLFAVFGVLVFFTWAAYRRDFRLTEMATGVVHGLEVTTKAVVDFVKAARS